MNKKYTICALFPILDGFYYGKMLSGIKQAALDLDIQLIMIQVMPEFSEESDYESNLAAAYADGWIVVLNSVTDAHLHHLSLDGKPIVSVGREINIANCTNIVSDNFDGAKKAVLHLIDHGHQNIAFVGCTLQYDTQQRLQGYLSALKERNLAFREDLFFDVSDNMQSGGREAAHKLLELKGPYTAVFTATDLNAIGVIEVLSEAGSRVPEDVAVFSFDDDEFAKIYNPPLSSVRQSPELLGAEAVKVLSRRFAGESHETSIFVKTELIPRRSCGCPMNPLGLESEDDPEDLQKSDPYNYEFGLILSQSIIHATSDKEDYLRWLECTRFHTGCLAVWRQEDNHPCELEIDKIYNARNHRFIESGVRIPEQLFPPLNILNNLKTDEHDFITLYPLRTPNHELGVLALIGPIDNQRVSYGYVYHQTNICVISLTKTLERKKLMEQLLQSELRYRDFFNNTPVSIYLIDKNTVLVDLNPYFHQLLGFSYEEMIGKNFVDFLTNESSTYMLETVLPLLSNNLSIVDVELQLVTKDGRIIDGLMNGEIIVDDHHISSHSYMTLRNITEQKTYEKQIAYIAYHDALTDLHNRFSFQKNIELIMANSNRFNLKIALMVIDLNRFKWVNDTYGHDIGDLLLQQVAAQIKMAIRDDDFIARLGGDEFVIILSNLSNMKQAELVRKKIMKKLEKSFLIKGNELAISASIGISIFPDDGRDAQTLFKKADIAMYEMKRKHHL